MPIHTEARIGFKNIQFASHWLDPANSRPFLRATLIPKNAWERHDLHSQKKKGSLFTASPPANGSRLGRKGPIPVPAVSYLACKTSLIAGSIAKRREERQAYDLQPRVPMPRHWTSDFLSTVVPGGLATTKPI